MALSQNIKRLRTGKNLTQEQLASMLGVSAQAVSKWETSDTYPDGALLAPLANALDVSLDTLFDNASVTMADLSGRIISLIRKTPAEEQFHLARDIGWQMERGMFRIPVSVYDPEEIKNIGNSSYIVSDWGFTAVNNGSAPFFSVFPETEHGYGSVIGDGEEMREIFARLASPETMRAALYIHRQVRDFVFEGALLAKECEIAKEKLPAVLADLTALRLIWEETLEVNGEKCTLYYAEPSHTLIALLLMAHELCYRGTYSLQSEGRSTPYLKS